MSSERKVNSGRDVFDAQLNRAVKIVDGTLGRLLEQQGELNSDLKKSMRYMLESPGKRIRSALVLWCCELVSGKVNADSELAAAAIEMVHTYSLVHDDLPAMDNDDLRRGQPTCHKAFDEATAILTGDALLTLAFEVLAAQISEPSVSVRLISELARSAGPAGMIAGQLADLKAEGTKANEKLLEYIHANKTAKMFRGAAAMGAIAGGTSEEEYNLLSEYGLKIGLCFQIMDDILDVSGSSEHLGKTVGKDEQAGKATYPVVVGLEKSKQLCEKLAQEAVVVLETLGAKADILRQLAMVLLERTR